MPNAVLESLAFSTPVIAPAHGSFPEIVQHESTGLLFHPGSVLDLAEKMKWMIEHPLESRLFGEAGSNFVKSHHSPDLHYQRLMSAISMANSTS
jgi:glycosyltransferase involved in cell wall biosynthesis